MRFERIVIKGLASFQGQRGSPKGSLDRELSGLDEIRLFVTRSYLFFVSFPSFYTLYRRCEIVGPRGCALGFRFATIDFVRYSGDDPASVI